MLRTYAETTPLFQKKKIGTDRLHESMFLVRVISANLFDRFTRAPSFRLGHSEAVDLTYNKYASFVIEINNISPRCSFGCIRNCKDQKKKIN